jgi:hypothetical protein
MLNLLKDNLTKSADLMQDLAEDTAFHYQIKTKSQQIIKHIIHNYTF